MANKNHGGKRNGSGRPKGAKNKSTEEIRQSKAELEKRIRASSDRLFNAQMTVAEGVTMLFKVKKDKKGNNLPPELVTSESEIKQFIDECGGYDGTMNDDTYYFLTTSKPDNKAIDSMLDRAYGKARQDMKVDLEVAEKPTPIMGGSSVQEDDGVSETTEAED